MYLHNAAGRGSISYLGFGLVGDYGISPGTYLGDLDGLPQDLRVMLTYTFEDQDLSVQAGYRRSWLEFSGEQGQYDYEADVTIDGYLIGIEFTF